MHAFDVQWFQWLHAGSRPAAGWLAFALVCAQPLAQVVGGLLLAAAVAGPSVWRRRAIQALLAVAIAAGLAALVHQAWPQPRPFMLGLGPLWLDHSPRPGLPSSHATAMFALACSLWLQGVRRSGAVVLLLGALVGWSRVFLGVHFPLDILAALPTAWAAAWLTRAGWRAGAAWRARAQQPQAASAG